MVNVSIRKKILIKLFNRGRVLNIGCGSLKLKNAVNLDINPDVKPDIIADLNNPLPFKDKSFDVVFAFDIIEHVKDPEKLVMEVERVSRRSVWFCLDFDECRENWYADPTHISYMNWKIWKKLFPFPKYIRFKIRGAMMAVKI